MGVFLQHLLHVHWCWQHFLFTRRRSEPEARPLPPRSVAAVAPAITQLSGGGASHYNAITHSFHPHSQPLRLPSPSCSPSPPCFALPFVPSLHIPAAPALTHHLRLHPMGLIFLPSTFNPHLHLPFLPFFHTFFHISGGFRDIRKGQRQSWRESGEVEAKGLKMRDEVKGENSMK